MSKQYVIVNGDDWQGIFVDGKLISEGHSFSSYELLEIVKEHGAVGEFWSLEPDMDWLEDRGGLPDTLRDVKLHEPFSIPAGLRLG